MTKREKYTDGMFELEYIQGNSRDVDGIKEALQAASPQGRLKKYKNLAEQVGIALDELHEAEELINTGGDYERIARLLTEAKYKLQAAAHAPVYPLAARGHKNKTSTRQGGLESRGTPEERQEMYEACQEEIDRLCLEKQHSYLQACKIAAKNIKKIYPDYLKETIHHDTIRKNTKNPY